jgi:antitoxin component of MazEF toxin-antitoxin module
MIEVESQIREWGRSFGVVIPKETVVKEGLLPGDTVEILIRKKGNPLRETFGILKFKKTTEEILKDSDREAWDE